MLLGIDTGGTFTDFVLVSGEGIRVHKVLSNPAEPDKAITTGLRQLGLEDRTGRIVHGTTVATNAVLERKLARTAYVTNRGFADALTIGRQNRPRLYDLTPPLVEPPVPAELCFETGGRIAAGGELLDPLTPADISELAARIAASEVEAVAINLLFSFLDPTHEKTVASALGGDLAVSCSSEVLPEYREYERGIATWLNAAVTPLLSGYFARLGDAFGENTLFIMQSSGETLAAEAAANSGVRLLLSGPAGGLAAAAKLAKETSRSRLLTLDMGGTSTDVAMVDGEIALTTEGRIGEFPVAVPMVDLHTIGAGGGSIARVDAGGLLQVGPESAGADPGPACYGRGGEEATVTDANLVLGRLVADDFLGGSMTLDPQRSWAALRKLGRQLGLDPKSAATGVVRVANEKMAAALRVISAERGHLPSRFALMSFGGAGGQHVCALADALGITTAYVAVHAGVLSAFGMLVARPGRRVSRAVLRNLDALDESALNGWYQSLEHNALQSLAKEGHATEDMAISRQVDVRYQGQSHALTLDWQGLGGLEGQFHDAHETLYGHRLVHAIEVVALRVAVRGPEPDLETATIGGQAAARAENPTVSDNRGMPVWRRAALAKNWSTSGPALITEPVATTYVAPGWTAALDSIGNIELTRHGGKNG